MATVDERRAAFQKYKQDVKDRGKPFYPYAMFHDTVMSLVVVSVIVGLALPVLDRRRQRRLLRRPVAIVAAILVVLSMGVLTYKGATAHEALASEVKAAVPGWAAREGFANNPVAVAGANAFAVSGCTACHTYLGTGGGLFGARDLGDEGTRKNAQA